MPPPMAVPIEGSFPAPKITSRTTRMRMTSGQPMDASYAPEPARTIARRLAGVDGVAAVTLGGSHAAGAADRHSDLDLGLYYRAERPPSLDALDELASELDDRHARGLVTAIGEWGPWINGGAWLQVGERRVDWLYRDLDRVERVLGDCEAGRVTCDYQPGHPHGFHNHTYAAEVHHAVVLEDESGVLAPLRERAMPYPPRLRAAILDRYGWEARFSAATAEKPAARGDAVYFAGAAFRSLACLVQVLYAINERWFLNEKASVAAAATFPVTVPGFAERATTVVNGRATLPERLGALEGLIADVEALARTA